jgi:hypothetical protein
MLDYEFFKFMSRREPYYLFWGSRMADGSYDLVKNLLLSVCHTCPPPLPPPEIQPPSEEPVDEPGLSPELDSLRHNRPQKPVLTDCRSDEVNIRQDIAAHCGQLTQLSCEFYQVYPYHTSDSLKRVRDSIAHLKKRLEQRAYTLIMCYQQALLCTQGIRQARPSMPLLKHNRSKVSFPPKAPASLLKPDNFFFIGAGKFLERMEKLDTNLQGEPEMRLYCQLNANTTRIMSMLRSMDNAPVETSFGPPVGFGHSEECHAWDKAIFGIGSLTHTLKRDLPVYLITTHGVTPGRLAQVIDLLFDPYQGCVSDQPKVRIGMTQLAKGEILGIFIPYEPISLDKCTVTQKKGKWLADLDGDGNADIGGYVRYASASVPGQLFEGVWYANINGEWKVIDWAEDLDCS